MHGDSPKPPIRRSRAGREAAPVSAAEARSLFSGFRRLPTLVLAVSGGPDSVALMWLAARWRRALKSGPRLIAVTVDHGLRKEGASEARAVKHLATSLGIDHRTARWTGTKPASGVPAAARDARYRLLARVAKEEGASHVAIAHTRDDQAETVLMRLSRGSGLSGLAAMARQSERDGIVLLRPLLDVPKTQLIATLKRAGIPFADDPTNREPRFTRPRLRALMPALAAEGADSHSLSRLARRLARADAALEIMACGAERYLGSIDAVGPATGYDFAAFMALAEEIRVRILMRAINRIGHEGPAELGKLEALLQALEQVPDLRVNDKTGHSGRSRFKQTLAGAVVAVEKGRLRIHPAPRRRGARMKDGPRTGPKKT